MKWLTVFLVLILWCPLGLAQTASLEQPIQLDHQPAFPWFSEKQFQGGVPVNPEFENVQQWWTSLPKAEKERFKYSALGMPDEHDLAELAAVNTAIKSLSYTYSLGAPPLKDEIFDEMALVDRFREEVDNQKTFSARLATLESIALHYAAYHCSALGIQGFIFTFPVQASQLPADEQLSFWPRWPDQPATSALKPYPHFAKSWNFNRWQSWYRDHHGLVRAVDGSTQDIVPITLLNEQKHFLIKHNDYRQTISSRWNHFKMAQSIDDRLLADYQDVYKTINQLSTNLSSGNRNAIAYRKALSKVFAAKEKPLQKNVKTARRELKRLADQLDAITSLTLEYKNDLDQITERLDELGNDIDVTNSALSRTQVSLLGVQAKLDQATIDLQETSIKAFDCKGMPVEECHVSQAYFDFELRRLGALGEQAEVVKDVSIDLVALGKSIKTLQDKRTKSTDELSVKREEYQTLSATHVESELKRKDMQSAHVVKTNEFNALEEEFNALSMARKALGQIKVARIEPANKAVPDAFPNCK